MVPNQLKKMKTTVFLEHIKWAKIIVNCVLKITLHPAVAPPTSTATYLPVSIYLEFGEYTLPHFRWQAWTPGLTFPISLNKVEFPSFANFQWVKLGLEPRGRETSIPAHGNNM